MQTTAQRLKAARDNAAKTNAVMASSKLAELYPEKIHHIDWRHNVARPFKKRHQAGRWSDDKPANHAGRAYYVDDLNKSGLRLAGDASEVLRGAGYWRTECDWYADNDQGAVIKSAVLQLPARDGAPRYIPATYCTDWDGATCYPLDWYDTKEEASRAAASYAEQEAEQSRDYYARDCAEQDTAEARQEIHRINAEALALVREIKKQGRAFSPAICQALRGKLLEFMRDRREQFAIIDARAADYWSAVQ